MLTSDVLISVIPYTLPLMTNCFPYELGMSEGWSVCLAPKLILFFLTQLLMM